MVFKTWANPWFGLLGQQHSEGKRILGRRKTGNTALTFTIVLGHLPPPSESHYSSAAHNETSTASSRPSPSSSQLSPHLSLLSVASLTLPLYDRLAQWLLPPVSNLCFIFVSFKRTIISYSRLTLWGHLQRCLWQLGKAEQHIMWQMEGADPGPVSWLFNQLVCFYMNFGRRHNCDLKDKWTDLLYLASCNRPQGISGLLQHMDSHG